MSALLLKRTLTTNQYRFIGNKMMSIVFMFPADVSRFLIFRLESVWITFIRLNCFRLTGWPSRIFKLNVVVLGFWVKIWYEINIGTRVANTVFSNSCRTCEQLEKRTSNKKNNGTVSCNMKIASSTAAVMTQKYYATAYSYIVVYSEGICCWYQGI